MDLRLRILKRRAETDPSFLPDYTRALERIIAGHAPEPVKVWTVIFCHEETSIEDVRVFATFDGAVIYIMQQQIQQMRQVHTEGANPAELLQTAEAAFVAGDSELLNNLYENMSDVMWFEFEEKELGP